MQIIRGLHNLKPHHRHCVATIGNFDGVHLGHQAVFRHLREKGRALGLATTVITFEPQPMEYFAPQQAPSRLTRLREKLAAIEHAGIDRVVILEFGPRLAAMESGTFVSELLVAGLDVRYLLVGDDFRFGRGRSGDIAALRQAGAVHGFGVENMNSFLVGDERVSSTRIRESLAAGDLERAACYLGRRYAICGRVAHGAKRGRTIGFPTLNINLQRRVSPLRGVFAVMVYGIERAALPGVANIGVRPTLQGDPRYLLESHLFDFNDSLYGKHLRVEFHHYLRHEQRFASFEALRRQIVEDARRARALLHR